MKKEALCQSFLAVLAEYEQLSTTEQRRRLATDISGHWWSLSSEWRLWMLELRDLVVRLGNASIYEVIITRIDEKTT